MFSILFAVIRISFSKSALDISRLVSLRASTRWCDAQHHPHEQAGSLLHKAASITFSAMGCGDRLPALRWLWGWASSLAMVLGRAFSSAMVVGTGFQLGDGCGAGFQLCEGCGAGFQLCDGCGGGLPAWRWLWGRASSLPFRHLPVGGATLRSPTTLKPLHAHKEVCDALAHLASLRFNSDASALNCDETLSAVSPPAGARPATMAP